MENMLKYDFMKYDIVCFIIELHKYTSGTPYIPQICKVGWSLYHSHDGIVAASRPLQIYTESVNPFGAVLSFFAV